MKLLTKKYIRSLLKPRTINSHKGTYGHSLLIAGKSGTVGAAVIAAKACLRSGTGLLSINIPKEERFILQSSIPEAMVMFRENKITNYETFSATGIGPGLGTGREQKKLLHAVLEKTQGHLVLDADALNLISSHKKLAVLIPPGTVITPHPKEFDRLFGIHNTEEERMAKAIAMAKIHQLIIVLKGHQTLITNGLETFRNSTGNAGLAKGGSGDALTGMITAFLAQGYKPIDATCIAVYIHGLAADITLKEQSMESMLITDVIDQIGSAFKSLFK
jgi:NAD(P)H-hydrate epimerase